MNMSSFKDHILNPNPEKVLSLDQKSNAVLPASYPRVLSVVLQKLSGISFLSIAEADRLSFSEKISNLVHSEEFLDEFDHSMKTTNDFKSEDDFVSQASKTMRDMLYKRFLNK